MGEYCRPNSLEDAFTRLSQGNWTLLAGGTDYFPAIVGYQPDDNLLDLTNIKALSGITETAEGWRIGATTTWTEIIKAPLPPLFDGLKTAASKIGGRQIQNAATIGGNICNASPAADGAVALLALGTGVEISDGQKTEKIPLEEFVLGNRKTVLKPDQMLTNFFIPALGCTHSHSTFLKLGARKYLVISLTMVSGVIGSDESGVIKECRISVGACSEVATRLTALEADLKGRRIGPKLGAILTDDYFTGLSPIDDVRASGEYRLHAAKTLVARLLTDWGQLND